MYLYDVLRELQVMDEMGFSRDQYCVMFDAAMVMHGMKKECDQIVIGGFQPIIRRLIKDGYEPQLPDGYPFVRFFRLNDRMIVISRDDVTRNNPWYFPIRSITTKLSGRYICYT